MDKIKTWFQDTSNTAWLTGGIVLLLVVVIVVLSTRSPEKTEEVTIDTPEQSVIDTDQKSPVSYTKPAVTTVPVDPKLSYTEAVQAYGGNRIQFGENCLATPANAVFKNGSKIMLDNRANQSKVLTIADVSYTVGARDFVVAALSISGESESIMIDCGSMQNVATVVVQR